MAASLTKRQSEVLELVREFVDRTGWPPTRSEIAKSLGFRSANAAEDHLRALARKEFVELVPGTSRGIRLIKSNIPGVSDLGLPVIGQVAAGQPILAVEHVEDYYSIDPSLFNVSPDYLLRVKGNSMIDAGILDGDLLVVHSSKVARNGQIVVARVGDEVTVKRFHKRGSKVRLFPENPDFKTIEVDLVSQEFGIEGLGIGVLRTTI